MAAIQPIADPAQASEAAQAVEALRSAINEFHKARHQTHRYLVGELVATDPATRRPIPAQVLVRRVAAGRDGRSEAQAAADLVAFQRLVLQREPSPQEAQAVLPPSHELGLGSFPVIGLAAIVGGGYALTRLFGYLADRERQLQRTLGIEAGAGIREKIAGTAAWLIPAALVVGVGVGGWYLLKRRPANEPPEENEREPTDDDNIAE